MAISARRFASGAHCYSILTHVTKAPPEQDACHRGYPASPRVASWDPYCSSAARRRRHLVRTRLNRVERGGMERVLDDQAAVAVTYEEMQPLLGSCQTRLASVRECHQRNG